MMDFYYELSYSKFVCVSSHPLSTQAMLCLTKIFAFLKIFEGIQTKRNIFAKFLVTIFSSKGICMCAHYNYKYVSKTQGEVRSM